MNIDLWYIQCTAIFILRRLFSMFCPHCGNNIADNTKFCPFCGASTGASDAAAPQTNPTTSYADPYAPQNTTNTPPSYMPNFNRSWPGKNSESEVYQCSCCCGCYCILHFHVLPVYFGIGHGVYAKCHVHGLHRNR